VNSSALFSWKGPWSETTRRLMQASNTCKIWFTCKGHLICTREGNKNYFAIPPLPIEEALREAQHLKEKVSEETNKRQKAELDLLSALDTVNIYFRNSSFRMRSEFIYERFTKYYVDHWVENIASTWEAPAGSNRGTTPCWNASGGQQEAAARVEKVHNRNAVR